MFVSVCVVTYQPPNTTVYQYLNNMNMKCVMKKNICNFVLESIASSSDPVIGYTSLQYVNINFYADYSNLEQTSLFIWYDNNKDTSNEVTKHVIRIYEKLIYDSMHYNSTQARICNTKDEKDAMTMSIISLILKSIMKNNIILDLNWASEVSYVWFLYQCALTLLTHSRSRFQVVYVPERDDVVTMFCSCHWCSTPVELVPNILLFHPSDLAHVMCNASVSICDVSNGNGTLQQIATKAIGFRCYCCSVLRAGCCGCMCGLWYL